MDKPKKLPRDFAIRWIQAGIVLPKLFGREISEQDNRELKEGNDAIQGIIELCREAQKYARGGRISPEAEFLIADFARQRIDMQCTLAMMINADPAWQAAIESRRAVQKVSAQNWPIVPKSPDSTCEMTIACNHSWYEYNDSYTGSGCHCWVCRNCNESHQDDPRTPGQKAEDYAAYAKERNEYAIRQREAASLRANEDAARRRALEKLTDEEIVLLRIPRWR
jgi:hypothetical protein